MVPEPGDGLLRNWIVIIARTIVVEDSKLILRHHIGGRLGLNPAPDVAVAPFEHCCHRRRDLSVLIVLCYL